MLISYPESNARRSVYAVLLFLVVLSPAILTVLAIRDVRAEWIQITAFFAGILGLPLLCTWCAVYVRDEPGRVRIALISIACIFFFLASVVVFYRPIVY